MNLFKKIMISAVSASIILGTCVVSHAAEMCTTCYQGRMVTTTQYSGWSRTGVTRHCSNPAFPWGEDIQVSRRVTQHISCNYCSIGYDKSYDEYDWQCFGHK